MALRGPPPEADDESEDLLEIQLLLQEDLMKVKKLKNTIAMVMAVVMTASSLTTYFPSYAAESESETETVTEVSESETEATEGETQGESGTTETTSETAAAESDSQESVESSGNDNSTVDSETEKKTETSNDTEAEEEEETGTPTYTVTLPYYEDADYTYDEEKLKEQVEDKSLVLEYEAGETVEVSIEPVEDILIDELHVFYSGNEEISFDWVEEDKKLTFSMPEQDVWLDVTLISAAESETESEQETESETTEEAWGWVEYDTTEGGSISASFEYYGEVFDAGTYTYDMMEYGPWEAQYETVGTITVTATADDGYVLKTITLTDEEGNEIASYDTDTVSFSADGTRKIIVTAVFAEADADAETVSESETEDSTEEGTESTSESESDTETETEPESELESASESEIESESETETETEAETSDEVEVNSNSEGMRVIGDWPTEQSTEYWPRAYVWCRDTYFDIAGYQYYGEDVLQECLTDLTDIDYTAGNSITVTYKCTLKQDNTYYWYAEMTYNFVETIGSATMKSDECDYIMPSVVTQSLNEGYNGIVPELAGTEVEGREYTVLAGDEDFDIYGLATDYNDDYFKVSMYDDGGFDVNTVGDYTVVYSMSYYLYPDYAWYVINTVHVVEDITENGITVIVDGATLSAEAADGKAEYGIWYSTDSTDFTMTVSDTYDLTLSVSATRDGEEVDPYDYVTVSDGEDGLQKLAAFSVADAAEHCYVFIMSNAEESDGKVLVNGGGWLPLDEDTIETLETADEDEAQEILDAISDAVAENDGDTSSLISDEESVISAVSSDANEGIMTAASYTTSTAGSFTASGTTGYQTGHNSDGSTETNYAYISLSGYADTINNKISSYGISVDEDDLGSLGIYCVSGHSYWGWPVRTSFTATVTVKVKEYSDGSYVVVLSASKTWGSGYQTFSGSKSLTAEPESATIQIRKSVVGYQMLLAAGLVSDVQTTFAVYEAKKKNGEYVLDSSTFVASLKMEDDTTTEVIAPGSGNYKMRGLFTIDSGVDYIVVETYRIKGTADFTDYIWGPYTDIEPGEVRTLGYINGKKSNGMVEDYAEGSSYARVDGDTYVTNWARVYTGALVHKFMDTDEDGEYDDTEEPLQGAVFKIDYYNTSTVSKVDTSSYPVIRTWYFMTDEDGLIKYDASHYLESWTDAETGTVYTSDELFDFTLTRNRYRLPVGSLKITEVEAPEGCVLESDASTIVSLCSPTGDDGELDYTTVHLVMRDENSASSNIYENGLEVPNYPETGYLYLVKESAVANVTDDNDMYDLTGTTYGVYTDEDCTEFAMAYVRDDSGEKTGETEAKLVVEAVEQADNSIIYETNTAELEPGTYYVKEISAGTGYEVDDTVYVVEIVYDETTIVNVEVEGVVYDTPMVYYTDLIVKKTTEANTSMSLVGGVFKLEFYAGATSASGTATRTWYLESDADGSVLLRDSYLASGYTSSSFYTDASGTICLPLGFLKITEEKEPTGYVRSDDVVTYTLTSTGWTISRNGTVEATGTVSTAASATISNETVQKAGYIDNEPIYGGVSLDKKDAETSDGSAQGDGSLAGFTFDIISENDFTVALSTDKSVAYSKGDAVMTLTTDENGHAESGTVIQAGTYTVVESGQNGAYMSDGTNTSYTITISEDGQVISYEVTNEVKKGGISLQKVDAETGESSAQGEASLEGAIFAIINASDYAVLNAEGSEIPTAKYVLSDTPTAVELRELAADGSYTMQTITTDANGFATTDADGDGTDDSLPYGTYYVVEIESSYGYWIDESFVGKAVVRSDGIVTALGTTDGESTFTDIYDGNDTTVDQTPRRGDLTFQKVDIDGNYKSFIPFLISAIVVDDAGNETVVESHVIVSDNGTVNTARTHSANTNGFDQYVENGVVTAEGEALLEEASTWGIWFGNLDAINDEYGSMYTCYYRITELQCEDNSSKSENLLESNLIYIDNTTGDETEVLSASTTNNAELHTYHPMVDTEIVLTSAALDAESGTQTVSVKSANEVTDEVSFTHVSADHTYRMETQFVDITDGNKVLAIVGTDDADATVSDDGLWVTKEFWTEQKSSTNNTYGDITMSATLDTTGLNGHTIVAVDYLYQYVNGYWILVAKHEDYTDTDQMLYVPDLHTSAVDGQTGSRVGTKSEDASILDTVTYSNLAKGEMYVITMQVINAETGEAVEDGKTVTSKRIYSRNDTPVSGTVEMPEFNLDSSAFDGDVTLVVVESLYRADEDGNPIGEAVLTHDSLVDEDQTIRYPDVHTSASDSLTGDDVGTSSEAATVYDEVTVTNVIFDDNDLNGQYTYTVKGTLVYQQDCTDADGVAHKAGETVETLDGTYDTVTITSDAAGNATFTYADGTTVKGTITITGYGQNIAKTAGGNAADNSYVTDSTAAVATITVELIYKVDSSKLEGNTVVVFEDLIHNDIVVASHADLTDEAQSVHYPEIHTTATDTDTSDHVGTVKEEAVIEDAVAYTNLVVGKEYTLTGTLYNRETGLPLLDEAGNTITATATFTATAESEDGCNTVTAYHEDNNSVDGTYLITFTLDSSLLAGKTVVAFESLYHNDIEVTTHADISDNDQSVYYPDIHTTALDSTTGSHVGSIWGALINFVRKALGQDTADDANEVITDTVALNNLVPGMTYVVSGKLYNVTESLETGVETPLVIDGKEITQAVTITVSEDGKAITVADGSKTSVTAYNEELNSVDGTVDLTYTLDSSKIQGIEVVVFEKLYQDITYTAETNPDEVKDEDLVNEHSDITDEGQSVSEISIHTTAVDTTTGDHVGTVLDDGATTSIHDEVNLAGLVVGMEYTIDGVLVSLGDSDLDSGEIYYLKVDGTLTDNREEAYTENLTFTAEATSETQILNIALTSDKVQGKSLTVFENIYHNGELISSHPAGDGDGWDEEALADQTVYYPTGKTNATDSATDEHMSLADTDRTIIDRVYFENLLVGQEYSITGQLVYKEAFTDADGTGHEAGEAVTDEVTVSFTAAADLTAASYADGSAAMVDSVTATTVANGQTVISGYVSISFTVDASKLAGATLVAFESFSHNNAETFTHNDLTDLPQTIKIPEIGTTASVNGIDEAAIYNADGSYADIVIIDTVNYKNLWTADELETMSEQAKYIEYSDGTTRTQDGVIYSVSEDAIYVLKGVLMDKETGETLVDSNGYTYTVYSDPFTPESSDGTYDVIFTINAGDFLDEDGESILAGKSLVVFEELYLASSEEEATEEKKVAEHKDIEDTDQDIRIPDGRTHAVPDNGTNTLSVQNLSIEAMETLHTSEADGAHQMQSAKTNTIVDYLAYENLHGGTVYTVTGTLMVITETDADGNPTAWETAVDDEGNAITVTETLDTSIISENYEDSVSGYLPLQFTVSALNLSGKTTVVFETISRDGVDVIVHADINDEAQTVEITPYDITVEISKKDITNSEELPGAHLIVKDADGNTVDEWTSTSEPHQIVNLALGTYTLTEVTAPDGYEVAETIEFTVEDTIEIQTVTMYDSPKESTTDLTGMTKTLTSSIASAVQTGDFFRYLPAVILIIAAAALASILVVDKKRKKK